MASFYPFPRLPAELRIKIWSFAFEPGRRIYLHNNERPEDCPPTPPPAVVQACREARQHAPYRKAYKRTFKDNYNLEGKKSEYIWVNYDADTIILNESRIGDRIPGSPWIRFLEIFISVSREILPSHMRKFSSLEAVTIVVMPEIYFYRTVGRMYAVPWPCPLSQVLVKVPSLSLGRIITLQECVFLDSLMYKRKPVRAKSLSGAEMDELVYQHLQAPLPPKMRTSDPEVNWWPWKPPRYCSQTKYPHATQVRRAIESHR